jgi:hypothetical protein
MADWNLKTQQQSTYVVGQGLSTYDKLYEGSTPSKGLYVTGPDGKEYVYVPKEFTTKGVELEQPMWQARPGANLSNPDALVKTQYYNTAYLDPKTFENAYSFKLPDSIKNSSTINADDFGGVSNYSDINKSGEGFLFPADYYNTVVNKPGNAGSYSTAYKNDKGEWVQQAEPLKGVGKINERIATANGIDASQPVYLAGAKQPDANTATQYFVSPATGGLQEKGITVKQNGPTWFGIGGVIGDVMGGIAQTIKDLGPIGQIGMMYATAGLGEMVGAQLGIGSLAGSAIVNGAMQVAQGKDIEDALTGAAKTIAIGAAAGQVSNSVLGEAAAEKYATTPGSEQTNMLANQEAGMGTIALNDILGTGANLSADLVGKTAGQTVGSVLAGNDIMSALTTGGINLGVPMLTAQIPGFSELDPRLQRAASIVIGNELQGKDPSQALINQAIQLGMDTVKTSGKNLSTNYASNLLAEGIDPDTFDAAELNQITQDDLAKIVSGGIGDATLEGGAGQDTLIGGQDSVVGGEATTQGGTGEDTIVSDTGTDTLLGGTGEDSVVGGEATTQGGTGTDTMDAGDGSDVIADDGTTEDIQKVIDDTKTEATDTTDTTCAEGFHWDETLGICVADDDETKTSTDCPDGYVYNVVTETCEPITTDTTDNTCAEGFHWDETLGICVADEDETKTSTDCPDGYVYNVVTETCEPITTDTTDTTDPTKTTSTGGGGTAKTTTSVPALTTTSVPTLKTTTSQGLDLNALLALLAADQQQAPTATPVVDIGEQLDLGSPLETNPFAKKQTQPKMAEGGSIDDLLALLQQRG